MTKALWAGCAHAEGHLQRGSSPKVSFGVNALRQLAAPQVGQGAEQGAQAATRAQTKALRRRLRSLTAMRQRTATFRVILPIRSVQMLARCWLKG